MFIATGHISKAAFNKETLGQTANSEHQDINHAAKPRRDRGCESQTIAFFRDQDLFSIMRTSREIRSQSGFGVGRKSKSLPSSSQQTGLPWLPGGTNAHQRSSASTFLHLAVVFSPFLPSPPLPSEAGLPMGCGGRRCETAEACVWAALLWVSLCVSALRALGRAGSGRQRVSV